MLVLELKMSNKVFQGRQADQSQQPPLDNITQEDKYPSENTTFSEKTFSTGKEISTCKSKWSCGGENCYHFSHELMTFEESKKFCKAMNSKLLKIEDKEELNFIQSQISYFFWIGLVRKEISPLWTWEDNSAPSLDVFTSSGWKASKPGDCGIITAKTIAPSDCLKRRPCICEKKIACLAT
ncbi:C-type lectin domain family 1 member B-like [Trichechus manatus latirostris]|uniref:C-type lectin domain family 1 member B-like n=1 Tax=Trichechus manatus latirostris TaxID=127582 RepID=A0A2Y9QIF0_TRIMA|nr:C-type lectin domain family 1 member B-like [Trichechus manatus latirostris]